MSDQSQVIATNNGDATPFAINPFALDTNQLDSVRSKIESAVNAKPSEMEDITPIYWEAKRGEVKTMVFLGWKIVNEKDKKTDEVTGQKFMPVFHDGSRQVVMGQLAAVEAMFGKPQNVAYKITCEESVAGKAKKFKVEMHNA